MLFRSYYQIDFTDYTAEKNFVYVEDMTSTSTENFLDYSFYNFDGLLESSFIREQEGMPYFGFFGSEKMIGNYAFANNTFEKYNSNTMTPLSTVVFAESIVDIRDHAFVSTPYLQTAIFENKVTGTYTFAKTGITTAIFKNGGEEGVTIDDGVFFNTTITNIELNGSFIKSIGNYTFYDCDSLELTNEGLEGQTTERFFTDIEHLGDYAFAYSDHVHSIRLPESLVSVGAHSFEHTSLSIVEFNGATVIGDYMFANNVNISQVTIPASVTSVGTHAFAYCAGLCDVDYYSSYIGDYMFYNCIHLSAAGDNVNDSMGALTFAFNSSTNGNILVSSQTNLYTSYISIGSDMRHIGKFAFALNTVVESIIVAEGLDYLGAYAFAFTGVTEIILPETSSFIGEGVLAGCDQIITVTIPFVGNSIGNTESKDSLFGWLFGSYVFDEELRGFYFESLLDNINETSNVGVADRPDDIYKGTETEADDRISIDITYKSLINESVFE